ncbi:mitochondrial coenzyme A diphosphatase NUDT8 isoform X2 [Octopus bimaculoides]|uniref:mitochondrial coenzyme A diphosphatase NUDT8 isoform X2 n=1 Tax=Octopus bimaculoides TaxID=37653 RepID=UPI0022DE9E05|nr:mitochondrial coenzyme A diphosphatase NUDT8 isoform X2 [Octopus bimaculoides]
MFLENTTIIWSFISFPGGMMDRSDADLTVTALRETHEEIGLDPKLIDVWGTMHPLPNKAASREVTPVVGFCGEIDLNSLHINPNEVEKVFFTTIKDLCNPDNQRMTQSRAGNGYTLPVYLSSSRIWGLTAVIVHQFLTVLAPHLYNFKIKHQRSIQKIK